MAKAKQTQPENAKYPLDIEFIPEFEKLNKLKINVFELIEEKDDEENIKYSTKILYNSYEKYKDVVSLLLFEKDDKQHYVWIKDINKLDKSNVATHASMYRCEYCLSARFMTKENLFKHIQTCSTSYINCNEELPKEGENILQFNNHCNKFQHPFNIVADFESTLIKVDDIENEQLDKDGEIIKTRKYQKHIPNSYGLKYNCIHDEYSKPVEIFNNSDPEEVRKVRRTIKIFL